MSPPSGKFGSAPGGMFMYTESSVNVGTGESLSANAKIMCESRPMGATVMPV